MDLYITSLEIISLLYIYRRKAATFGARMYVFHGTSNKISFGATHELHSTSHSTRRQRWAQQQSSLVDCASPSSQNRSAWPVLFCLDTCVFIALTPITVVFYTPPPPTASTKCTNITHELTFRRIRS